MKKNKTVILSALLVLSLLFTCLFASCARYSTLEEFLNSAEFKNAMGNNTVEGMNISFEAENDDTVKINYDLTYAIPDENLEFARSSYKETLEDKDSISSLKQAYDAVQGLFPSKDIKLHVVFKDANGTMIAERTYSSVDFK